MQKVELQAKSGTRALAGYLPGPSVIPIQGKRHDLSPALSCILAEVQKAIGYEVSDTEGESLGSSEIQALISETAARLGFELSTAERDEILSQVEKDGKPFGVLQPLVDNPQVSDIIVTSYCKVGVQQGRKNFDTGISFPSEAAYEAFVERLLQKAGSTYSTKKPVADGMVGSFARIHVVHRCICDSGPYLTIRLNRFSRVMMPDLAARGLAPEPVLNYLSGLINSGQTVLVVGEVGTGKTTLARALAATIPVTESILVIEDTPEIILEHPHVRYMRTRDSNTDGAGRVSPAECIRAGMRMAMNRIIFGEMRDAEAAEAFIDVCASGHPGLSTIHARSAAEAVSRLELFLGRAQRGAARNIFVEQIATAVQAIVYVDVCRESGKRRIIEIREIGPVADRVLRQREMFRYSFVDGLPVWQMMCRVSAHRFELENLDKPVILSNLPSVVELSPEILLKEVAEKREVRKKAT